MAWVDSNGVTTLTTQIKTLSDNTYATKAVATTSANGLMSAADKTKLDQVLTTDDLPGFAGITLTTVKTITRIVT